MRDFFISYNKADRTWAEWIAWQLEEAGHTTVLQAWDFQPGSNFVLEMDRASREAQRTLAVLSPDYLAALYTHPEWAAAFAQDPTGAKGLLLPVRVRECELRGLLAQIVYVDLVGRDEKAAKQELLAQVSRLLKGPGGRGKPTVAPAFPGTAERSVPQRPSFPGTSEPRPDGGRRRWIRWVAGAVAAVAAAVGLTLLWPYLRPAATPAECLLTAEMRYPDPRGRVRAMELTLNIEGNGVTNGFTLGSRGVAAIHVLPEQLPNWYVEVIDANGNALGAAQLEGCPQAPREVRLHEDMLLILRPR